MCPPLPRPASPHRPRQPLSSGRAPQHESPARASTGQVRGASPAWPPATKQTGSLFPFPAANPRGVAGGSRGSSLPWDIDPTLKTDPNPVYPKARDPTQGEGEKSCQHPLLKETRVKPPLGTRGAGRVCRCACSVRAATGPGFAVGLVGVQRRSLARSKHIPGLLGASGTSANRKESIKAT